MSWGGPRPGSGRPPKPRAEKQSQAVQLNLTPGERAELERAAGAEPLGAFLRRLVLRSLSQRRK